MKTSLSILYFQTLVPLHILFTENGALDQAGWLRLWNEIGDAGEVKRTIQGINCGSGVEGIRGRLVGNNIFVVAGRVVEGAHLLYTSTRLPDGTIFLNEFRFERGFGECIVSSKTYARHLVGVFLDGVEGVLKT